MRRRWFALAVTFVAAASFLTSCSSDEVEGSDVPTRAEVYAAVQASTSPDTDGDGLPDDVETRWQAVLGTDPTKADTDGDGANDAVEVFGQSWIWVQSRGQAGAPVGAESAGLANHPTQDQEADAVDSDGDGVPDWVEYEGYRYDWTRARFVADAAGVRTDPLQWSTDQDAYSDGMEVSGINMDVAVREPGNHPLVPAYPDISVELMGYSVTLNSEITYGEGGAIETGTTWSREVERSHSLEMEIGTEVTVGASISLTDLGCSMEVTQSFSVTNTDTTSVSCATGGSVIEESNWNTTRSSNPSRAAFMKLYVKVRNLGTAPASNIIPTLSLRIGGADVATFEPPSLSVATLLPGGVFPPDESVAWVIDTVAEGRELTLTDWELRALESRAPVSLSVAQKRADVMRLEDGRWERVGDAGDYLARILSITTDLFADVGAGPDGVEGNFIHARVASDDSVTSPPVTLADALRWAMNFRVEGDHYAVDLRKLDGSVTPIALTGRIGEGGEFLDDGEWRWQVDALTIARNWLVPPEVIELKDLLGMRLGPLSRIALRAPRQVDQARPAIHSAWATSSSEHSHVVTCVSDYDGIEAVFFQDEQGTRTQLSRDGRGPYFYSGTVVGALKGTGVERIVAVSTRKVAGSDPPEAVTSDGPVRVIYQYEPEPPVIEDVRYTPAAGGAQDRFYARVSSATSAINQVRVYLADSTFVELAPVANLFEDPDGWEKRGFGTWRDGMRIVARSADMLYTVESLSALDDYVPYRTGPLTISASFDWTGDDEWWIQLTDLERPTPPEVWQYYTESNSYGNPDTLLNFWKYHITGGNPVGWTLEGNGLADLYLRDSQWACGVYYLGFFQAGMKAPSDGQAYYAGVTRKTITDFRSQFTNGWLASGKTQEALAEPLVNNVFFFETPEGRLGKLLVTARAADGSGWPYENCWTTVTAHYTVFVKPATP